MTRPFLAIAFALTLTGSAEGQNRLVGVVVSRSTGERLAFSIVGLPRLGHERFATDSGVFHFTNLPRGPVAVRVRRLGYLPLDTVVVVGPSQPDTVRIALPRVAVRLGEVTVRAFPPCLNPGAPLIEKDSALTVIFNQIRMNAEQYKFLSEQYPFYSTMEVIRSSRVKTDGQTRIDSHRVGRIEAKSEWKYKPGRVVQRRGTNFYFHIPTLVDFADRDFIAQHCFHFGGVEDVDGEKFLRVQVVAAESIRQPDVNGSIYIDPVNFQVRRTLLRLSRITREMRLLMDFEVTTEFREIMTSIPIIASVASVEKLDPEAKIDFDMAWETHKLAGFGFLKKKPGDDSKPTP
jgi:hypothetical protein